MEYNYQIKTIRKVVEKEIYKYWGILEADTIKQSEMKEKKRGVSHTKKKSFKPKPIAGIK